MPEIKLTFRIDGPFDNEKLLKRFVEAGFKQIKTEINLPTYILHGEFPGSAVDLFDKCKKIFQKIQIEEIISEYKKNKGC